MNILDALLAAHNGGAVAKLGDQFGLPPERASAALSALVPALAAGLARNATQEGGLAGLTAALSGGRHGRYLDDLGALTQPETTADGNGILGHILGSKDVSRQVATEAAQSSGVGADVLKRMLPVVAAMMMGALAKNAAGGSLTSGMGGGPGGGLLDKLTPMLDADRDGSVVDDVTGMLGKFLGKR